MKNYIFEWKKINGQGNMKIPIVMWRQTVKSLCNIK